MKKTLLFVTTLLISQAVWGQENVFQTFKDRWVINAHSVEMLPKNRMDFRVTHRFGDLAGASGGWETFYGLESASDVLIGFEYGATDNLSVGIFRTKGAGDLKQLVSPTIKYRFLQQAAGGAPITLTAVGVGSISTMKKIAESEGLNSFPKFSHRMVSNLQLLAARKYSDAFSLQVSAGWTHRNLSPFGEVNDIFNIGFATRIQVSHALSLVGDFVLPLNGVQNPFNDSAGATYSPIIGLGIEIETGGHVFQINLVNAQGIMPTDYTPYTRNAEWGKGQFRLGFTISPMFKIR